MGVLYLVIVGAILGWLAAILLQAENREGLKRNLGAGLAGALITGLIVSPLVGSGSLLSGTYRVTALLLSVLGSVALIAAVNLLRPRHHHRHMR